MFTAIFRYLERKLEQCFQLISESTKTEDKTTKFMNGAITGRIVALDSGYAPIMILLTSFLVPLTVIDILFLISVVVLASMLVSGLIYLFLA